MTSRVSIWALHAVIMWFGSRLATVRQTAAAAIRGLRSAMLLICVASMDPDVSTVRNTRCPVWGAALKDSWNASSSRIVQVDGVSTKIAIYYTPDSG